MWKKNEEAPQPGRPAPTPAARPRVSQKASVIGPSIRIKGDLTGKEDLVIQGQIEGEVRLQENNVTVGDAGRIRADIYGRSVHVEGEVKGHLFGEQEVIIRASGKVQGDIVSPRVVLENGSNFKGSIDMEPAKTVAVQETPKIEEKTVPVATTSAGASQGDSGASSKTGRDDSQTSPAPKHAPAAGNRP